MSVETRGPLRIAVIGGGPAGSFFALYALKYASTAGRGVSVTIFEGKDFRGPGPASCNMCAGIVPVSDLSQFRELGIAVPPEMILSRVSSYALHTSAGTVNAKQPDPRAEIISVYRGGGPRHGREPGQPSFDEWLLQEAVARGAELRRHFVEAVRRGSGIEIDCDGKTERFDLVVLSTGVNGRQFSMQGFAYRPPPTETMCQTELYYGADGVRERLGSSVHIFLPHQNIASFGILVPKGPYVTVSLLRPRGGASSMRQFMNLEDVKSVLGSDTRRTCSCLPRISVGPGGNVVADGFVAIGDASATRLYKNGIGSALATAQRAAWTAIYRGHAVAELSSHYLPLCQAVHRDNQIGKFLFLQVPLLKRFSIVSRAHHRLATRPEKRGKAVELHTRILWGMFTGAYSYQDLFRMAVSPSMVVQLALELARSLLGTPAPGARS